jgi:hypothetical protein
LQVICKLSTQCTACMWFKSSLLQIFWGSFRTKLTSNLKSWFASALFQVILAWCTFSDYYQLSEHCVLSYLCCEEWLTVQALYISRFKLICCTGTAGTWKFHCPMTYSFDHQKICCHLHVMHCFWKRQERGEMPMSEFMKAT